MADEKRRLVGVKRSSLAGLAEEWGEECYAYIQPSTYEDQLKVDEFNAASKTQAEQIAWQADFVLSHFVSGKVKAFDGSQFELVDMTAEDTKATVGVLDKLFADIMGFDLDPKDIRKVAEERSLQNKSATTTKKS